MLVANVFVTTSICSVAGSLDALRRRAGNRVPSTEAAAEARDGAPGRLPEKNQVTDGDPTRARAAET